MAVMARMSSSETNAAGPGPDVQHFLARILQIAREVEDRGINPVPVDYSEITRIPGSFRSSTMPLERKG
jgi:N-dimethylarginine dimethylaminohydrolase